MSEPVLPPVILASQSPRRRDLLARSGLEFNIVVKPTDELLDPAMDPPALCLANAREKARVVAMEYPGSTVIGADTLVFIGNTPLGKPRDETDAVAMLTRLSGQTHRVCTGVSIQSPLGDTDLAEITEVTFRDLTPAVITRYMSLVNVFDKAGSYALQEHGDLIIREVNGDVDNVIGFPLSRVICALKKWGYKFGI